MDSGVYLATLDISRAYKNFILDPLDWPLLCFRWDKMYYCDVTVPFGARADADFSIARKLFRELALPEALDKAQPPTQCIKWLGININTVEMTLSIPQKLQQVLDTVCKYTKARSMSKRQLQSLLGILLHVTKCVRPARLFVARLLEALRAARGTYINVNTEMRADFRWFQEFCSAWNGSSYIPPAAPSREIYVDACLSGIGGSDGQSAYRGQIAQIQDGAINITELEALNVAVALHSFLSKADEGTHVRVYCDNSAAVQVLTSGRGKNRLLLDCVRAAWMVQVVLAVQITYEHVPGKDNEVADTLSRVHLNDKYRHLADHIISDHELNVIQPCLYALHNLPTPLLSRSGSRIVAEQGKAQTAPGTRPRYMGEPGINSGGLRRLRKEDQVRPTPGQPLHDVCVPGVPGLVYCCTSHHQEQSIPYPGLSQDGGRTHGWNQPPHSTPGDRGHAKKQGICPPDQGCSANEKPKVGDFRNSKYTRRSGRPGSHTPDVLWRPAPVRGAPTNSQVVRSLETPYEGRCRD